LLDISILVQWKENNLLIQNSKCLTEFQALQETYWIFISTFLATREIISKLLKETIKLQSNRYMSQKKWSLQELSENFAPPLQLKIESV